MRLKEYEVWAIKDAVYSIDKTAKFFFSDHGLMIKKRAGI
jgi:hypothetical protein